MKIIVITIAVAVFAATVFAGDKADHAIKGKYHSLEIAQFTIKPGIGFPQDYMSKMQSDLLNEIVEKHKFEQVFSADNKPASWTAPLLRLEGEVIEYKAGSQAKRYWVGMGAGKTKVVAHVKFIDSKTNEVVFEDNKRLGDSQLRRGLKLTEGKAFDSELVQLDVKQIVKSYSPLGYIFQPADPEPRTTAHPRAR